MLSLVFNPLGLPVDAAIALMLAVDPLIDPIITLVNVHTNCTCTALIAKPVNNTD
jgi:proton glutamate symport protein